MADNLDVTFTDDIPKIEREGGKRTSKYAPLIDACVENSGKAARIVVDNQGQASSRASSIRTAADGHAAVKNGDGHFKVATRSAEVDGETEYYVYVQYNEGVEEEAEETEEEETPKPKKKAAKKVARKKA